MRNPSEAYPAKRRTGWYEHNVTKNMRSCLFGWFVAAIAAGIAAEVDAQTPSRSPQPKPALADAPPLPSDWNRFRGPDGMGQSEARNLPITWDANTHVAWRTPIPGPGASSPVVWGNRVYLTYYSGYFVPDQPGGSLEQLKRHLMAVSLADGSLLWDREVAAKLPEEEQIRDHGYAASSPVVDAERIYCFFGKSGLIAFDHEGNQLWQADVGESTNGWGSAASPILFEDLVIVNASVESESLRALDRKTGKEIWRVDEIRESWNTPIIVASDSGRAELVLAAQGRLMGVAPGTGELLWSCATDITWYMVPSPVALDGIVYCLGGRSGVAGLAVRTGGSGDVTETHRLWTSLKGTNVSSPVVAGKYLYWVHDQRGVAFCAEVETGNVVYEERLPRAEQVYASALMADGRIYYLTREGKTFVVAAKPEFEQLAVNDLSDGSLFNGSPAVAGDRLLLRSDKFLYCVRN